MSQALKLEYTDKNGGVEARRQHGMDGFRAWVVIGTTCNDSDPYGQRQSVILDAWDETEFRACDNLIQKVQAFGMNASFNLADNVIPVYKRSAKETVTKEDSKAVISMLGAKKSDDN